MPFDHAVAPEHREMLAALEAGVDAHDAQHFPIQHATARFHLGASLLGLGQLEHAVAHLLVARDLFPPDGLPVEHAKACNMLGVAMRDLGRLEEAAAAFREASQHFATAGHAIEQAAADFNGALVLRDLDDLSAASDGFRAALATFEQVDAREHAAAAARELGATLFAAQAHAEAESVLLRAMDLARRGGDRAGLGTAANVLGIVRLRAGDLDGAAAAFQDAVGAHPRSIRPHEHAMAKANLALAHERCGRADHARLAAQQALALDADRPVHEQASAVLARVGVDPEGLLRVLTSTPEQAQLARVLREEVLRTVDVPEDLLVVAQPLMAGVATGDEATGRAWSEAWLEVLLELPPTPFLRAITVTVDAVLHLDAARADVARRRIARGAGAFHVPQWLRLKDALRTEATRRGDPLHEAWG